MSINLARKVTRRTDDDDIKPPFLPPMLCAIASLILPGAGHILARAYRAGLIILGSFLSFVGLLVWRVNLAATLGAKPETLMATFAKSFRLQPLLVFILISLVIFYLWSAIDAYLAAKSNRHSSLALFVVIIFVFFILGWQIGEINVFRMVSQASDAGPALMKVVWPWERAISYPAVTTIKKVIVESPCTDSAPVYESPILDEPYLVVSPTCGEPSEAQGVTGTTLTLEGYNFDPGKKVDLWWRDPINNEFRQRQGGEYITPMPDENGNFSIEIIWPYRLLSPSLAGKVTEWEIQARQVTSLGKAVPSQELKLAIEKIIETIFIGMMATLFGIILAVPFSFLAARNLMSGSKVTMVVYYMTRTVMNIIRSIEPLIWAIIAVIVVGLGPFAGILALTLHSIASLAKLYSEAIESIDAGPIEAIQATGANWYQVVMYAVVPQVIPPFVSFTIYRWDINIRMSTIIGFVGGGGIGFLLSQWIRLLDYRAAGIAVWFIAITVAILDYVSAEIRAKFV